MTPSISRQELVLLLRAAPDLVLVEALGPDWYADAHLPRAVNIPPLAVEALAPRLLPDRDAPVVVYCSRTTTEAVVVAAELQRLGYTDVAVYDAGKEDWIEAGLAVERNF